MADIYTIRRNGTRGIFLSIANSQFDNFNERRGCFEDEKMLKELFCDQLGFIPQSHRNLKNQEILQVIDACATNEDHKQYDCVVCALSSHGGKDRVYGTDGEDNENPDDNPCQYSVPTREYIIDRLAASKYLRGKPKLFLIQACQGNRRMPGVEYPEEEDYEVDAVGPTISDILIFESTVPGYEAYRSTTKGSIFLLEFCNIMKQQCDYLDLEHIFKKLNKTLRSIKFQIEPEVQVHQQCQMQSTLIKDFYLKNPAPIDPPPVEIIEDAVVDDDAFENSSEATDEDQEISSKKTDNPSNETDLLVPKTSTKSCCECCAVL